MKIGILQTGHAPEDLQPEYGNYDDAFIRLLSGHGFDFKTYDMLKMQIPAQPDEADGWLITGSRHGAYEDLPWIPPLEEFLRQAYGAAVPIVGICFGHQILAQALGGRVEKYAKGWSAGAVEYHSELFGDQRMMAWHQDQVVKLPKGAKVVGSSDFCAHAMLLYGDRALTVQPHPEFTAPFMAGLLQTRGDLLPEQNRQEADSSLTKPLTSLSFADQIAAFFKKPRDKTRA